MAIAPDPKRDLDERAERELLRRMQAGDRDALTALYSRYERRLYAFCHRLVGNADDAADLVQETFLRVIRRLPELDPERLNLSAYLYTTARNLFYKQAERAKRVQLEERMEDVAPAADVLEEDPERAALLQAQQEEVRNANLRLAPRQRMVLALRELEDRSYAEIGEILGMKENAVAQLISRARIRLREELRMGQIDRDALSPATQRLLPVLAAYVDGQLKGEQLQAVEAALAESAECRAVVDAFSGASKRYRALVPAVPLVFLTGAVAKAAEAEGLVRPSQTGGGAPAGPGEGAGATVAPTLELPAVEAAAVGGGAGAGGDGGDGADPRRSLGSRLARHKVAIGALVVLALLGGGTAYVMAGGDGGPVVAPASTVALDVTSAAPTSTPAPPPTSAEEPAATTDVAATAPPTTTDAPPSSSGPPDGPPNVRGGVATAVPPPPSVPVVSTEQEPTTTEAPETTTQAPPPPPTSSQAPPVSDQGGDVTVKKPPPSTVPSSPPPTTTQAPPPPTTTQAPPPPATTEAPPPTTTQAPPPQPNLVIGGLSSAMTPGAAGNIVGWSITVANVGDGAAGPSALTFRSKGGSQAFSIGSLGPGSSQTVSLRYLCAGNDDVATATADARGSVAESNEGDNSASAGLSAPCR